MKLTRLRILFIAIIAVLLALWVLEIFAGFDLVQAIFANLPFVVVGIIFLSFMSVIGGFFLGMWISARLFSTKGFTPFEEEMLRMREEVKEMRGQLKRMEKEGAAGWSADRTGGASEASPPSLPVISPAATPPLPGPAFQSTGGGPAGSLRSAAPEDPAGGDALRGKQI